MGGTERGTHTAGPAVAQDGRTDGHALRPTPKRRNVRRAAERLNRRGCAGAHEHNCRPHGYAKDLSDQTCRHGSNGRPVCEAALADTATAERVFCWVFFCFLVASECAARQTGKLAGHLEWLSLTRAGAKTETRAQRNRFAATGRRDLKFPKCYTAGCIHNTSSGVGGGTGEEIAASGGRAAGLAAVPANRQLKSTPAKCPSDSGKRGEKKINYPTQKARREKRNVSRQLGGSVVCRRDRSGGERGGDSFHGPWARRGES